MSNSLDEVDYLVSESKLYKLSLSSFYNDPLAYRRLSFDLQQLVEKTLKLYISLTGITIPKAHQIEKLLLMCKDHSVPIIINDWIKQNSYELTAWATNGRYETVPYMTLSKLKTATAEVFKFLNSNGIQDELFTEITNSTLAEIECYCGKKLDNYSNAKRNVLYCLYIRKIEKQEIRDMSFKEYFESFGITDTVAEMKRLQLLYGTSDKQIILHNVYRDFM